MDTKARNKARNKAIGSNIARLRGQMSQSEVAKAMSERGHSWIQTTVSAVESGERALKLTEAVDLAEVLKAPLEAVASETVGVYDTETELRRSMTMLWASYEGAIQALKGFNDTRSEVFIDTINRLRAPDSHSQEVSAQTLESFAKINATCNLAAVVFNAFGDEYGNEDLYVPHAARQSQQWQDSKAQAIAKQTGVKVDTSAVFPAPSEINETLDLLNQIMKSQGNRKQKPNP